ncbi:putative dnaJ -like subfamily B member 9-like [Scophthalmus maximus]|uniref:DnaJ homolog subfamily B member 9 n=1 Tax=Scophthalmus maximus TaxID=52904 RepID=A0A2U9BGQ7_SCOMX|nr:putative dnaJ -like subfamily B member 9-like [Scophthalmus maximus]
MAPRGVSHRLRACVVLLLCLSEALPPAAASDPSRNFYDTLRVEPTATGGQIKKAFRRLAVKYHPDKSRSADAEKTFREMAEAYRVLSNEEKRRLYDSVGHEAFLKNQGFVDAEEYTSSHFSFPDFFHDFNDSPFGEEPHFTWSFPPDWEDEDGPQEPYGFEGPGFSFYFGDGDEIEDEYPY